MSKDPLERLLPRAGGSVYRLVRMAANRALELSEGKRCIVENPISDKITTQALQEIAEGKIVYKEAVDENPVPEPEEKPEETEEEGSKESAEVGA